MVKLGTIAETKLGVDPDKNSAAYEKFDHEHFGQTGRPLLSCFAAECNLVCALHTILGLLRQ